MTWNELNRSLLLSLDASSLGYLSLGSLICLLFTAKVKILKVISRVSYYFSMSPGRFCEPKQQCWPERPLKTNLNSLWLRTFIYPADTGPIAPGCLIEPRSVFQTSSTYKQGRLWQSRSRWSMSRCVCVCLWACMYCTCDKCYVWDGAALPGASLRSCYFVQWLKCLFFFFISSSSSPCVSLRLTRFPELLFCTRLWFLL